jgi:hypothetical protein
MYEDEFAGIMEAGKPPVTDLYAQCSGSGTPAVEQVTPRLLMGNMVRYDTLSYRTSAVSSPYVDVAPKRRDRPFVTALTPIDRIAMRNALAEAK